MGEGIPQWEKIHYKAEIQENLLLRDAGPKEEDLSRIPGFSFY